MVLEGDGRLLPFFPYPPLKTAVSIHGQQSSNRLVNRYVQSQKKKNKNIEIDNDIRKSLEFTSFRSISKIDAKILTTIETTIMSLYGEPKYFDYGAFGHPALRILRKCENLICVQVVLCRLQRLMRKPTSPRKKNCFLIYDSDFAPFSSYQ
jgi:hypothetical protein